MTQPVTLEILTFAWNCHFEKSAEYTSTMTFFGIDSLMHELLLGLLKQQIRVVKLWNLTAQQVWNITIVGAVLAFIATVLAVIDGIRKLKKPIGAA